MSRGWSLSSGFWIGVVMPLHFAIILVASGGVTFATAAAAVQLDPGIVAQGQVLSGTARGYAERGGWREGRCPAVTRRQVEACGMKAGFRARHGANDPQVRELYRRCLLIGL